MARHRALLFRTFLCRFCTKTTIGFKQQMDSSNPPKEFVWTPNNLIYQHFKLGNGHVCLVLNRKISIPPKIVKCLWKNALIRCAVDGGANHWRDYILENYELNKEGKPNINPPDLITGDFDSITKETVEFFHATPKIHTPDQNATDFSKAVSLLQPAMEQHQIRDLIVFQDCSGRFDQIMANINTIHKMQKDKLNIFLLSGSSITWLLRTGRHTIKIPRQLVDEKRWCALIPVGEHVRSVTTTGLKWNLFRATLEFGGMVSTSNTYAAETVVIETTHSLIWSMGAYACE